MAVPIDPAGFGEPPKLNPNVYKHVPLAQAELRDDIATRVLIEFVKANPKKGELKGFKRELAATAYELADAMMEARQR